MNLSLHQFHHRRKKTQFIDKEKDSHSPREFIVKSDHEYGEYISSISLRPKLNCYFRLSLNLEILNANAE